jgi:hypothetical protein
MHNKMAAVAMMILTFAISAAAQTTVTSSGTMATTGNVPYVSASTSMYTTVSPSPIYVWNGKLGIGTPGPTGLLHLYSDSPRILLQNSGIYGSTWQFISDGTGNFWINNPITNVNPFQISSSGNVGITGALSSPQARLHVMAYTPGSEIMRLH